MTVLAPHAPGAARTEFMDGVEIVRFRYAPERFERLAYGGGMLANLRASPLAWWLVPAFLVAQYRAASRLIRRNRTQLVHAHWVLPQGAVAALLLRRHGVPLKSVLTAHGSDVLRLNGGLAIRLRHWATSRATAVTVVSEELQRRLMNETDATGAVYVMPMGTDLMRTFTPSAADAREPATLLFVGRLAPEKGPQHLIDALVSVRAARPDVRLLLAGTGPDEIPLRARAQQQGVAESVEFLGFVDHNRLPALYRRATALVAPSLSEGFGLALVEALGCECPVIASDLPAIREIVQPGETGITVPPGDARGFSAAIVMILDDPARARMMARAGRQRCLERFDWQQVAGAYRELFADLLKSAA